MVLVVTGSSPYPSFKLMAYSAPLFTLLVLSARSSTPANLRPALTTRRGCYRTCNRQRARGVLFPRKYLARGLDRIPDASGNTDVCDCPVPRKHSPQNGDSSQRRGRLGAGVARVLPSETGRSRFSRLHSQFVGYSKNDAAPGAEKFRTYPHDVSHP